jgi:hypothetical protein
VPTAPHLQREQRPTVCFYVLPKKYYCTISNFLKDTSSRIQPLSSSPPTFWPASIPPQPTSAASYGTMSSTQSYNTAKEHQPLPGGPHDSWSGAPLGNSLLSYSMQDARYAPAPGTLPSPSIKDDRRLTIPGIVFGPGTTPKYSSARPPGPPEYTNPDSGVSFSRQELFELRNGKQNEKGDLVFFQPSFVDPNPWAVVRRASGRAGY